MGHDHRSRMLVSALSSFPIIILIFLILTRPALSSDTAAPKNVLILYSFSDRNVFGSADFLKSAIRTRISRPVNFYVEYLEAQRFEKDADSEQSLVETLRAAYGKEDLALVMVAAYPALQFAVRHRDELFPGVPIVFMEVYAGRLTGQKMWPGVTGVTEIVDVPGTIDLALRLHPGTKTVAVVTGDSQWERYWLASVHAELLHHQDKVREVDLVGLPLDQVLEKVAALPTDTVFCSKKLLNNRSSPRSDHMTLSNGSVSGCLRTASSRYSA